MNYTDSPKYKTELNDLESYLTLIGYRNNTIQGYLQTVFECCELQTVNCFDSLQVAILGKPPERKKSPIQESKIGDSSEGSYPQRL